MYSCFINLNKWKNLQFMTNKKKKPAVLWCNVIIIHKMFKIPGVMSFSVLALLTAEQEMIN